jgi:DNA-directed RNA polymerase sigma subunit (sigma70/sigma32)
MTASSGLLRAEEEVVLAIDIEAGVFAAERLAAGAADGELAQDLVDDLRAIEEQGRRAFDRFVGSNVRLAAWWARRLAATRIAGSVSVEDLAAEGVLGVIRAVHKWDYRRGLKFSTYAVYWIRNFQHRHLVRARAVGLSFAEHEECVRLVQTHELLEQRLQRTPSAEDIAAELGTTRRRVEELQRMLASPVSLDSPAARDPGRDSMGDLLPDPGCDVGDLLAAADMVHQLLKVLDARERDVLTELFGLCDGTPRTVEELGQQRRLPARLIAETAQTALGKLRAAAQAAAEELGAEAAA